MKNKLFEDHYKKNFKSIVKMVGGSLRGRGLSTDAEDIVQEAYANGLQYWHPLIENFDNWFKRILWTTTSSYGSDRPFKYNYESDLHHLLPQQKEVDWMYFYKYISKKNDTQKTILKEFFYTGLPPRDINQLHKIKLSTIKNTISLFRQEIVDDYNFVRL